jgi:hypothetical protein
VCGGQIPGQAFQQGFAVVGAGLASLLEFNDVAADMPITGGDETIEARAAARRASSRSWEMPAKS